MHAVHPYGNGKSLIARPPEARPPPAARPPPLAASAAGIAKLLFFVFVALALISFFWGLLRRG